LGGLRERHVVACRIKINISILFVVKFKMVNKRANSNKQKNYNNKNKNNNFKLIFICALFKHGDGQLQNHRLCTNMTLRFIYKKKS